MIQDSPRVFHVKHFPVLANMKPSIPHDQPGRDVFHVKPVAHDDSNPLTEWFHVKHSMPFAQ